MNRMSHCCGCFSVRTGTLILGWLGFLSSLLGLVIYIIMMAYEGTIDDMLHQTMIQGHITEEQKQSFQMIRNFLPMLLIGCIVLCAFQTLITGLLLVGTFKKRSCLMMPYLILGMIGLVLNAIQVVVLPIVSGQPVGAIVMNVVLGGAFVLLGFYFWYCVYCHYKDVKEQAENQGVFQPMKA